MAVFEAKALTVAIITAWVVLLIRFGLTLYRHFLNDGVVRPRIYWPMWSIALFIILAGTTYHPAVTNYFSTVVAPWFGPVPRTFFALMPYLYCSQVSAPFLPTYRLPRWHWATATGILVFGCYLLLRSYIANFPTAGGPSDMRLVLPDTLFHFFILLVTARIVLPTLRWLQFQEENPVLRLRLSLLIIMYLAIIVWMFDSISSKLLFVLTGRTFILSATFETLAVVTITVSFLLAFFAPPRFYRWLVLRIRHFGQLKVYMHVRLLEAFVCRQAPIQMMPANWQEALRFPELALYRSVINILDTRKLLKNQPQMKTTTLIEQIDFAASPGISYETVTARLARAGALLLAHLPTTLLQTLDSGGN